MVPLPNFACQQVKLVCQWASLINSCLVYAYCMFGSSGHEGYNRKVCVIWAPSEFTAVMITQEAWVMLDVSWVFWDPSWVTKIVSPEPACS